MPTGGAPLVLLFWPEGGGRGQRRPEPEPTSVMAATPSALKKLLVEFAWFGRIVSMV